MRSSIYKITGVEERVAVCWGRAICVRSISTPDAECGFEQIMASTSCKKVARQLMLHRGVHPIVMSEGHLWSANKDKVSCPKRLQRSHE
jgi:hypothetical protein